METQEEKVYENPAPLEQNKDEVVEEDDVSEPTPHRVFAIFATFLGIPLLLCGTCILNMAIYDATRVNETFLMVVWLGFPVVLCIIIAWLTKNIGVIIGMLLFILAAILYIAAQ